MKIHPTVSSRSTRSGKVFLRWWQIHPGIPGERCDGRLVEIPHQEDPDRADKKYRCHDNKTDPVNHPGHQEPLFILLN